jgi:hypothetical protein
LSIERSRSRNTGEACTAAALYFVLFMTITPSF